jgi:PadR family transcriptional regulator
LRRARLEGERLLASRLAPSREGPARRYYRLTDAGATALAERAAEWRALVAGLDALLADGLPAADRGTAVR